MATCCFLCQDPMYDKDIELGLEDAADELKRMEDLEIARKELEKVKGEKPVSQKMFRAI